MIKFLSNSSRSYNILLIIIIAAAIFYFWNLGQHDVATDEATYMVRGIGMLDFNSGILQPTPLEWVERTPWWMYLSFHDHPPLVFLMERIFFGIFGEDVLVGRIPPLLAGLASILFVFLIAERIFSRKAGMLSALIFAFTTNHVWISRIALQESLVIALMLAALYVFLLALDDKRKLIHAGVLLGFAFLAKYTAVILIPIFLTVLLLRTRRYFVSREFLIGVLLFFVVVSPVVIYNVGLYQRFGHFDFQFSYIFGQDVEGWEYAPGKEAAGSLGERFKNYAPNLLKLNSPLLLLLFIGGFLYSLFAAVKKDSRQLLLLIFFLWFAASMLVIGPSLRFLSMLTPWLAIFAALALVWVGERMFQIKPRLVTAFFAAVIIIEAAYAFNSVIALTPIGKIPWTYAGVRSVNDNWGYNQLEEFLEKEFGHKRPGYVASFQYPVIAEILQERVSRDEREGRPKEYAAFVYNGNMAMPAQLWIFLKRLTYHGWPVVDTETYKRVLQENGDDFFKRLGVEKLYFINTAEGVVLRTPMTRPLTEDANNFEKVLQQKGIPAKEIKNLRGETAFRVYEFAP